MCYNYTMIFRRMADAEKQVSAQVRGRKILAVRYGETYRPPLMLNESGAYIFRQYMAGNTADKIAEELATMYGGTADDMRTDVMQFIRQMELQGIL